MGGEHRIRCGKYGVVIPGRHQIPGVGKIVTESRLVDRDAARGIAAKEGNHVAPDRGRGLVPGEGEDAGNRTAEAQTPPRGRPAGASVVLHRSGMYHATPTPTPYHPGVSDLPPTLATFPSLDQAESALDWIGVDFADGDGCFEGELAADDAELLDAALADPETPEPVRALAALLRDLLAAAADEPANAGALKWRVGFTA